MLMPLRVGSCSGDIEGDGALLDEIEGFTDGGLLEIDARGMMISSSLRLMREVPRVSIVG